MNQYSVIGLDTAKSTFHLVELMPNGREVGRRQLRRSQVSRHFANMDPKRIAMEACSAGHHWARCFQSMGHQVELLPAQHIKGYLRGQKNDYNDASAIAEACLHNRIRPVQVKSLEQQDIQALHRSREQLKKSRNQLVNQMRGFLRERGVAIPLGVASIRQAVPSLLETPNEEITGFLRELLARDDRRLLALDEELEWHDRQIQQTVKASEVCRRLRQLPSFGPIVSSAVANWIGGRTPVQARTRCLGSTGIGPQTTHHRRPAQAGLHQ